jgi:hypothetical protein
LPRSISSSFHARRHFFIAFSRAIRLGDRRILLDMNEHPHPVFAGEAARPPPMLP